jgi:tetratricopeptide (TPR) repeat protein
MPPLEAGPAYSAPPGLGLPDQAPLGEASNPPMEGSYMAGASSASPAPPPSAPRRTFEQLQQAIAQDSTDSTAYYQLARMFQARGAMGQSLEMYQNVARLDPLNAGAQNDLGVLYFQRGNLKDAETTLRRATALDPFSPQAHYNLGLLLLRTGRRSDAQQEFNRAAQNAPAGSAGQVFAEAQNGRPAGPLLYPGL